MKRRLDSDAGFSLVELGVALALSGMVVGTLVTVFLSFSQNVGDSERRAEHQALSRELIAEIVVELRQAMRANPNGDPVESVGPDQLAFYTIQVGSSEPVRTVYERTDCSAGICELWVTRYAVDTFVSGVYTFLSTPREESFLLGGVLEDQPLFYGIDWVGDPKVQVHAASCGGLVACDFPLVGITLRSYPLNTSDGARQVLEIQEEVRIRNG